MRDAQLCVSCAWGYSLCNERDPNVTSRTPILKSLGSIWGSFWLRKMQVRKHQGSEHAGCTTLRQCCAGFLIVQRKCPECQMLNSNFEWFGMHLGIIYGSENASSKAPRFGAGGMHNFASVVRGVPHVQRKGLECQT